MEKIVSFMDYAQDKDMDKYKEVLISLKEYVLKAIASLPKEAIDDNNHKMIDNFDKFIDDIMNHKIFNSRELKIYLDNVNKLFQNADQKDYNCLDVVVYSCMIQEAGSKIFKFDFKMIETILNMFVQMDTLVEEFKRYLLILLNEDIEDVILEYNVDLRNTRFLIILFQAIEDNMGIFNEKNESVISGIRKNIIRDIRRYYKSLKHFGEEKPRLEEPVSMEKALSYIDKCMEFLEDDMMYGTYASKFLDIIKNFKKVIRYVPLNYQSLFIRELKILFQEMMWMICLG